MDEANNSKRASDCEPELSHGETSQWTRPLFIVGPGRGGTTYLQRLLLADPHFCGGQESHFFVTFGAVVRDFESKMKSPRPHGLSCYWDRATLLAHLRGLWRSLCEPCLRDHPGASILLEKSPSHAHWIDVILEVLPKARFLHIIRDSRAVCASLLAANKDGWGKDWAPDNLATACERWNKSAANVMASASSLHVRQYHRLRYEDLRSQPLEEMAKIHAWLGLEFDPVVGQEALQANAVEKVRSGDGPGFWYGGEWRGNPPAEPDEFVRQGKAGHWKQELNLWQRKYIWWRTKRWMLALGYDKKGPITAA